MQRKCKISYEARFQNVERTNGVDDASQVEPGGQIVEPAPVSQNGPELSAKAGLHQQVHVFAVTKSAK